MYYIVCGYNELWIVIYYHLCYIVTCVYIYYIYYIVLFMYHGMKYFELENFTISSFYGKYCHEFYDELQQRVSFFLQDLA